METAPCTVEDTEEIFCLRKTDDYQSHVALGNALAAQYCSREAIETYREALLIRSDDWTAYNRLASAYLTIRRFDEAKECYHRCLALGVDEKRWRFPGVSGTISMETGLPQRTGLKNVCPAETN